MNCIAVLNLRDVWPAKARKSFEAAASRWNVDLHEITQPVAKGVHVWWQKAMVWRQALDQYERVLQMDADMLIRADCPNPFDRVPQGHFGVVSAHQVVDGPNFERARDLSIRTWAERMGCKPCPDWRHLNAGFLLYDRGLRKWLDQWQGVGAHFNYKPMGLPEQSVLSLMLYNQPEIPQYWLPHGFNRVAANGANSPALQHLGPSPMRDWVYHFTGGTGKPKGLEGDASKENRIHNVWWNVAPDHQDVPARTREILDRLPDDARMAELGVLRGDNALALLRSKDDLDLALIDKWSGHHSWSYMESGDRQATRDSFANWTILNKLHTALRNYADRTSILQADTARAARMFDGESLDLVFVDADHSRRGCSDDIRAWWPKVAPGGWIGGHDYGVRNATWKWGVKEVVDEFVRAEGLDLERGGDNTWFVRKPTDG